MCRPIVGPGSQWKKVGNLVQRSSIRFPARTRFHSVEIFLILDDTFISQYDLLKINK